MIRKSLVLSLTVAAMVIALASPLSCRITEEGIQIIGGDYAAPVLEKVSVVDSRTVQFDFSEPVKVSSVIVTPYMPGISDSERASATENLAPSLAAAAGEYGWIDTQVTSSEDGKTVTFLLSKDAEIGKSYEVYGVVEDGIGNSLTFCVPFIGYNSAVPRMIMTEVQIKYGKGSSAGSTIYRAEYVELLALENGNLAGLVLSSASDGSKKDYEFPAVDVKKGEIVLVHLRTVGEGCVNEDGEDLNLATAPHSAAGVRDLWSESVDAHFNDSSDVIILRDTVNNEIIDGIMYAAPDASEWKTAVAQFAYDLFDAGIYQSEEISSASSSKGCTTLKSLTRTDASEILSLVNSDEDCDYDFPFVADESTWAVSACTPGYL